MTESAVKFFRLAPDAYQIVRQYEPLRAAVIPSAAVHWTEDPIIPALDALISRLGRSRTTFSPENVRWRQLVELRDVITDPVLIGIALAPTICSITWIGKKIVGGA